METRVSAILLAAGRSQRMGAPKPLLPIRGRPAVVRCLECLRDSQVPDIVVVVNPEGGAIAEAAGEFPVRVAVNELPGSDMAESVKAGLSLVDRDATGVLVCLCDHPLVSPETIAAMASAHSRMPGAIVIPAWRGRRGHPTLFPRLLLEGLETFATLRDIIGHHDSEISILDVNDEGVVLDMDTPEDYQRILDRQARSHLQRPAGKAGPGKSEG
ncbi:MAG: nucleotidyltransferase family protein [Syntrophaceae bacterium]